MTTKPDWISQQDHLEVRAGIAVAISAYSDSFGGSELTLPDVNGLMEKITDRLYSVVEAQFEATKNARLSEEARARIQNISA